MDFKLFTEDDKRCLVFKGYFSSGIKLHPEIL